MEAALAAWNQRYEYERIDQGFFASEAEAFAQGCVALAQSNNSLTDRLRGRRLASPTILMPWVSADYTLHAPTPTDRRVLVRLTVAAASDLPLLKEPGTEDHAALPGGKAGANNKLLLQQAQKLAARAGAGGKGSQGEKGLPASHPLVAVTLERPRPALGLLVGHTNTEYATQAPVFGTNAHAKLCPHGGRSREAFVAAGATRLAPAGPGQGQAFLFYAPKVGK